MADNEIDAIYGTEPSVAFARRMAESLLKERPSYNAGMQVLPGTWKLGVPDLLRSLAGAQYRDIAGGQDLALNKRMLDPNAKSGVDTYGRWAKQPTNNPSAGLNPAPKPGLEGEDPLGLTSIKNQAQPQTKIAGLEDYVPKLIMTESGGNPNSINKYGYRGLGQFNKAEEAKYGITNDNWRDPVVQKKAIAQKAMDDRAELAAKLGREPTWGETYLAHQQGVGGATNHLSNPNAPAWLNMYNTAEGQGRKDGETWAKRSITANLPRGHALSKLPIDEIKSGDFAKLWTSRFDGEPTAPVVGVPGAAPPVAPAPAIPPDARMGLGGPISTEGAPPPTAALLGDRVAQGLPGYTTTPSNDINVSQPGRNIPGYQGPVPPMPPLESQEQLLARLNAASPTDRQKILDEYQKRAQGTAYDTPGGGKLINTPSPGGAPGITTHMPGPDIPLGLPGLNLHMRQNPQGGFDLILPGGGTKSFGSVNDLMEWARGQQAATIEATGRAGAQATRYEDQYKHIEQTYPNVIARADQLALAQKLVNDPAFIGGTGQQRREAISKFFETIGAAPPGEGADVTQAFTKLIAGNILDDIKGLGGMGLGQIRAKEMEVIEKMNAMPDMSPGAMKAVVNLTQRMNKRIQDYYDRALDYASDHGDKIDSKFIQEMRKHYAKPENRFLSEEEISNYKDLFKSDKEKTKMPSTYVPGKGWQ